MRPNIVRIEEPVNHARELNILRGIAIQFAQDHDGLCSINDVRRMVKELGLGMNLDGPQIKSYMGSVFDRNWAWNPNGYHRPDGTHRPAVEFAEHTGGKGRMIRCWRLRAGNVTFRPVVGRSRQLELIETKSEIDFI